MVSFLPPPPVAGAVPPPGADEEGAEDPFPPGEHPANVIAPSSRAVMPVSLRTCVSFSDIDGLTLTLRGRPSALRAFTHLSQLWERGDDCAHRWPGREWVRGPDGY